MKENFPGGDNNKGQNDDKKMSRREFLGWGAAVLTAAALGTAGKKLGDLIEHVQEEKEKHEKIGEATVIDKHHADSYNQLLSFGKIPTVTPKPEQWSMTFKMENEQSSVRVSKEVYEKYNVGDSVPVKYDDRNKVVNEVIN
jgi:hypothetical protein